MRRSAIILILAVTLIVVAGAGCTSKNNEDKAATNTGQDSQRGSNAVDQSTLTKTTNTGQDLQQGSNAVNQSTPRSSQEGEVMVFTVPEMNIDDYRATHDPNTHKYSEDLTYVFGAPNQWSHLMGQVSIDSLPAKIGTSDGNIQMYLNPLKDTGEQEKFQKAVTGNISMNNGPNCSSIVWAVLINQKGETQSPDARVYDERCADIISGGNFTLPLSQYDPSEKPSKLYFDVAFYNKTQSQ
jgi:hypothetical protein